MNHIRYCWICFVYMRNSVHACMHMYFNSQLSQMFWLLEYGFMWYIMFFIMQHICILYIYIHSVRNDEWLCIYSPNLSF